MAEKTQLVSNKDRDKIELFLYSILDTIDPSHTNSDYYREIFAKMDNNEFYHFFERRLPIRFHYEIFKIEPKMYEIIDAFKILDKPLFEKVNLPHVYINKEGKPVQSEECLVIYVHIKRLQQMISIKSHASMNIDKRDMKTGLLTGDNKGAKETDREFEALASYGLEHTMNELSRPRADALRAGVEMNNVIMAKGFVSEKDYRIENTDSLSKNLMNVYLLGANIHSNLVDKNYMTPYTAKNKQRQIERM